MNSTSPNSNPSIPGNTPEPALDAHAQWLTGSGGAALSVVRLSGKDCWGILQKRFRGQNGELPPAYRPGLARLGSLCDENGHGDQLLLVCRYFKGKQVIELQSHHGVLADAHLARTLAQAGFRVESSPAPTTSVEPAELNLALEKERWLPFVPNRIALQRFLGWIERDWPLGIAKLNAHLDALELAEALRLVQASLAAARIGKHLFSPLRVAFLGVPNAGKSSLLNALVGYERALVSPTAGTTRDLVRASLAHDGWVFDVVDTAGIRSAANDLEAQGIERSLELARQADLAVWLIDSTEPAGPPTHITPDLIVLTKVDLTASLNPSLAGLAGEYRAAGAIATSAKTGLGLEALLNALVGKLIGSVPAPGVLIPFSPALIGCLTRLEKLIQTESIPEAKNLLALLSGPVVKDAGPAAKKPS